MHVRITIQNLVYLTYRMIPKYGDGRHIQSAKLVNCTILSINPMDTEDDIRVVGQGIFDALMIRL
jgi:hypothetical protein